MFVIFCDLYLYLIWILKRVLFCLNSQEKVEEYLEYVWLLYVCVELINRQSKELYNVQSCKRIDTHINTYIHTHHTQTNTHTHTHTGWLAAGQDDCTLLIIANICTLYLCQGDWKSAVYVNRVVYFTNFGCPSLFQGGRGNWTLNHVLGLYFGSKILGIFFKSYCLVP